MEWSLKLFSFKGLVAHEANISHISMDQYLTQNPDRLIYLKSLQSSDEYNVDVMAGPVASEDVATKLQDQARYCWIKKVTLSFI